MATSEFINLVCLLLFMSFSSIQPTLATTNITTNEMFAVVDPIKPKMLVAKLLHHDSLFYNPNNTIEHFAERILHTSITRFTHLSQTTPHSIGVSFRPTTRPTSGLGQIAFYVNFSVGEPPIPQLAIMDTGSDLILIECVSEDYHFYDSPTFDSLTYHSYRKYCNNDCKKGNDYKLPGIIGTEKFKFNIVDGDPFEVEEVVFGCADGSHYIFRSDLFRSGNVSGVFGLSAHGPKFSLVKLLGSQFSYCVGSIFVGDYSYNKLVIGEGSIEYGDSTPLIADAYYYITFQGISIGDKMLDIDLDDFKKTKRGNSEVIIDTGSPLTWLLRSVYETLKKEVANLGVELGMIRTYDADKDWSLCYYGEVKDVVDFPSLTMHFADGADLVLDRSSIFYQKKARMFCLAFALSEDLSVLGMIAQQNYSVSYDLLEEKLHFSRTHCDLNYE